jgi:perosamine synthetase
MNIPYGRQTINSDDIQSVLDVLNSDFLTCGPLVKQFEDKICNKVNSKYGLAVNSGTAALHLAMYAIDIKSGDEVIVPAISFVASANCVLYEGGKPIFCDIDPDTLLIDINKIETLITSKTKAVIAVDFAGQGVDYIKIRELCDKYKLYFIQDAAHSLGVQYKDGKMIGEVADITTFSFHPVKNITTGEGGMTVTNNEEFYKRMLHFRTHGITRDFRERLTSNTHYYEMVDLGFNYRLPDILCALGISQLEKLDKFIEKRNEIAKIYDNKLDKTKYTYLKQIDNNAYHLYVIKTSGDRDEIFKQLKSAGICVNVHYMPIYLHPYYQKLGYTKGLCPKSEEVYEQIISLPIFPLLKNNELDYVINTMNSI